MSRFSLAFALVGILSGAVCVDATEEWRTVHIEQGPLRGRYDPDYGIYAFYDIPYATAPTGTERFKAPRPPPVWISTFDAVNRNIVCPQIIPSGNVQEDCLVASVYVPNTLETNLPVAVNIHGGAFTIGSGNVETLSALVQSNRTIAVTFNYRLGVHGFLCLGTEDAPGNAGLKDQVALLRWVKQNIASFGGNPEDVTILGCSAGGGSVDVLTLSSAANGLFSKAVIESGASTGAAGVQIDPMENAKRYARVLNFSNVDDIGALEDFYKTASFETLIQRSDYISMTIEGAVVFAPCVEKYLGEERILEEAPLNTILNGNYNKVPLLYGYTNMEGQFRLVNFDSWSVQMNEKFSDFLPIDLQFVNETEKEAVAQMVKSFYFGDRDVSLDTIESYINYFTDQMFSYAMIRQLSLRLKSLNDTVYLFEYSYYDENSSIVSEYDVRGAGHCHQAIAIRDEINENDMSEEYREVKSILRELWLNFITTGNPVPENSELPAWPPATTARSPYMSIGRVVELRDVILEERGTFWDEIYENYSRDPMAPSIGGAATFAISKILLSILLLNLYR